MVLSSTFIAFQREAQFTNEILGAGVTDIRRANYATKGLYFKAFTSLTTGLERIGKMCIIIDYYLKNGIYPSETLMKHFGHNLEILYRESESIAESRSIKFDFLKKVDGEIHKRIMGVLSDFAKGDRYSNVQIITNNHRRKDPVFRWYEEIDMEIYNTCISDAKKERIKKNAALMNEMFGSHIFVRHNCEDYTSIIGLEDASIQTGIFECVAPYRQFYCLQIIRWWVELLTGLQDAAHQTNSRDIPHLSEIFAHFHNPDRRLKSRKTWMQ